MEYDLRVENLVKRFGDFTAVRGVSFSVERGKFFSILGPSGCGKTTLLRMIAGFLEPSEGEIYIRGRLVNSIPPNRRPVNMVFQNLALFPMMSVGENIAFGLKRRKLPRDEIKKRVRVILERVGLPGFENKRIDQISGGQKQRVAIARCLVLEPSVLLLDEPLGALDLKMREQMKVELKKLQKEVGTTFVYITHDQSEALVMSDYVAVMNEGRFEQIDTPQNLYIKPKSPFVAKFVGENNMWECDVVSRRGRVLHLKSREGCRLVAETDENTAFFKRCLLFVRPEAIEVNPAGEAKGDFNILNVTLKSVLFDGANSKLLVSTRTGKEIMVAMPQNADIDGFRSGAEIKIGWKAENGVVFGDV